MRAVWSFVVACDPQAARGIRPSSVCRVNLSRMMLDAVYRECKSCGSGPSYTTHLARLMKIDKYLLRRLARGAPQE